MASMQVLSGSPAAAGASGSQSGALDPLMAGFSAEAVAAAAGQAGSGTPENPFADQLAGALAALEAQQAAAMAKALADQALVDGQIAADAALLMPNGQNLPLDPAFQNAILATFAAVNGAVQADGLVAGLEGGNGQALVGPQLVGPPTAEELLAAGLTPEQIAAAQAATDAELLAAQAVAQQQAVDAAQAIADATAADLKHSDLADSANPQILATATTATAPTNAVMGADQADALAVAGAGKDAALAAAAKPIANGDQTAATNGMANNAVNATATEGVVKVATTTNSSNTNTSAGDSSQQQSANAAALAAAAAPKAAVEAPEVASTKETSLAGNLAGDAGNVVVTAKANAEGVAAAADAARQSAGRLDATSGVSASQSAESAAARAESRLEAARASLGSGPLNVEVLKLTKQGGGRAVLEVTPPNQGPIRLDLQLDGAGRANLVVEGLTESMKARLESSAHFLRQDMAQMGLALNLEMRERNDSNASAQAFTQGQFGQSNGGREGSSTGTGSNTTSVGAASGNTTARTGSISADDGIHLVA